VAPAGRQRGNLGASREAEGQPGRQPGGRGATWAPAGRQRGGLGASLGGGEAAWEPAWEASPTCQTKLDLLDQGSR
jgi:hypothetical protein